jgi:threonine/homoserine/homoserine lactone efflux protein
MITFLASGIILGLSAGFAPGPILALVISETLNHDKRAGIKVALAPIITDLPIVTLTLFILSKLSGFHGVLGIISLLGGCFILYLGFENIRTKGMSVRLDEDKPRSLQKGIIVNLLSPHPYLFWLSVGGPLTIKAMQHSIIAAAAFISSFYILLIGSKILIAIAVGKSKSFLTDKTYIYTMRLLGTMLVLLALFLFKDGLYLLGIV